MRIPTLFLSLRNPLTFLSLRKPVTVIARFFPLATAAFCASFTGAATGQTPPSGPLDSLPELTDLQFNTAHAVMTLCPQLPAPNPSGTLVQRLSHSCTAMVVTAANNEGKINDLAAAVGVPADVLLQNFNLNISTDRLRKAVQDIAPVQMNAQKQISTESAKMSLIGVRLLDLREGTRGFVLGLNGREAVPKPTGQSEGRALAGATGGGAAADTPLGGRLGGFLNIAYNWGNVDQTDVQDAYDYRNYNVIGGLDYRVTDALVLGGAISYSDTHSDFDNSLGNVKARTTSIAAYGTYYVAEWFVDGFVAYGWANYDSTRNILVPSGNPGIAPFNTSATASPNGHEWSASVGVGRNFPLAATWTITPTARLAYIRVKNDAFTEDEPINGLGLAVDERTVKSFQSALGGRLSTNMSTTVGVFGPYLTLNWMHEFENNNPSIISKYVNDPFNTIFVIPTASPTRDYGVVMVGSTATLPNNLSGFAQFSAAFGLRDQTNYGIVLGVRKQF